MKLLGIRFVGVNAQNGEKLLLTIALIVGILLLRAAIVGVAHLVTGQNRNERITGQDSQHDEDDHRDPDQSPEGEERATKQILLHERTTGRRTRVWRPEERGGSSAKMSSISSRRLRLWRRRTFGRSRYPAWSSSSGSGSISSR